MNKYNLDNAIRKVPDFPKPGIMFYDVTSIFTNPEAFAWVVDKACDFYKDQHIDEILIVESRGFIVGSTLAYKLGLPMVLARKKGKLPGKTVDESYSLEYGEATLEVHKEDITPGANVLIIDDLIATGGTLKACANLIEKLDAKVAGFFGIIGLPFLKYEEVLKGYNITTLINYDSE
jgi:adenine phosphoribosyltransferase